jgi:hypothetical protein
MIFIVSNPPGSKFALFALGIVGSAAVGNCCVRNGHPQQETAGLDIQLCQPFNAAINQL